MMRSWLLLSLLVLVGCGRGPGLSSSPTGETSQGWVSSGGEIVTDKQNPWFLGNVAVARYCVAVDETTVSLAPDRIDALIERGLQYWKKEFSPFRPTAAFGLQIPAVATQDFQRVACDGSEDIRFQFGYGTLSADQREFLQRQRRYLSLAVRTAYDPRAMRGRGFVYIASDRGEQRQPQGSLFIDQPWRYEGLLFRVLLHELGHVFGLPHLGNGLMAELYPETLLHHGVAEKYETVEPLESFFAPQQSYANCSLSKDKDLTAMQWLGMNTDDKCLYIDIPTGKTGEAHLTFTSSAVAGGERHPVGTADGEVDSSAFGQISLGGKVFFPPEQQVFSDPSYNGVKYLPTSVFLSVGFSVNYVSHTRAEHPLQMTLSPDGYELRNFEGGEIRALLSYRKACESALSFQYCLEM